MFETTKQYIYIYNPLIISRYTHSHQVTEVASEDRLDDKETLGA